ncbi:MFS transporter [Nesterenkonia sp. CL21]|uniref:MFS transporter n=1 Tax=Nesterenkonia sp. CL21 TaxID=3064894 RepID=UPI0028795896|nr:MFS transporter [Nesterenkonia sp. CL21]MDS2172704.1 MFS transporter [Nesterenkonia sp. CL21]
MTAAPPQPVHPSRRGSRRLPARTLLGFVGTWVVALMAANLVPVLISRLISDLNLPLSSAGALATGMTAGTVAAMLAVNLIIARADRPTVARIGLATMLIGYALGAATMTPTAVAVGLIIGGMGGGAALAAGTAAFSATHDPDRTVTIATVINRLGAAGLLALAPVIASDLRSLLVLLAAMAAAGLLLARGLPNTPGARHASSADESPQTTRPPRAPGRGTITLAGLVLAFSMGFWSLAEDMVYAMSGTLAADAGISPETTGVLISLKVIGGLLGVVLAPLMLANFGRGWSLLGIVVVSTTAKFLMIITESGTVFAATIVIWGIAYGAVLVLVNGLAALMDLTGRTAVLVFSIYMCGIALGPLAGGYFLEFVTPLTYAFIVSVPSAVFGSALFIISRRSRHFDRPRTVQLHDTGPSLPAEAESADASAISDTTPRPH